MIFFFCKVSYISQHSPSFHTLYASHAKFFPEVSECLSSSGMPFQLPVVHKRCPWSASCVLYFRLAYKDSQSYQIYPYLCKSKTVFFLVYAMQIYGRVLVHFNLSSISVSCPTHTHTHCPWEKQFLVLTEKKATCPPKKWSRPAREEKNLLLLP